MSYQVESRRVVVQSLEPVRPGSAAEVHLGAAVAGFRSAGWDVLSSWRESGKGRFWAILVDQIRIVGASRDADFVYSRWHVLGVIQYFLFRIVGRPYVVEVNGTVDDLVLAHPRFRVLKPLLLRAAGWQLRHAAGIVSVTTGHGQWALALAGRDVPVHVAPNGAHRAIASMRAPAVTPKYAVFVGELAPWQGVDCLLAAFTSEYWPRGLRLVVVGDGAMRSKVEQYSELSGVEFTGRLPREEALRLMAGACVSVSPQSGKYSRNRIGVSPIKVAESLFLGVPVVASDLPGLSELIAQAPGGVTFRADDCDELARAVGVASNYDASTRQRVAAFGESALQWETVIDRVARFCAEVVR